MCGIAGFFATRRAVDGETAIAAVRRMSDAIAHRGPDDSDLWTDASAGIALGHRRLSIIDLSPLGRQPMASANGRYLISYNGEVYNFPDLRAELEAAGQRFRGGSDTEVMLAAISLWGLDRAVTRFAGMFAFALWDRQRRELHLVRDRMGVKPLYWSLQDGLLLFGSELKALMAHPRWIGKVDPEAVAALVRYSYVPAPATIFRGVHKLRPGTILTIGPDGEPHTSPYWRLQDVAAKGQANLIHDQAEAEAQLDAILREAVAGRMIADVPLGAFLSGGIDSSTVVALMQAQSSRRVRTFSIGFHDETYNEAAHAKAVAGHLGTDHTELYVEAQDALAVIPELPRFFDEPFADSSQIPTYLVSAMTRKHVTVALSGDGGDELFAGYPRYQFVSHVWRRLASAPRGLRSGLAAMLRSVPEETIDRIAAFAPRSLRVRGAGRKSRRAADILSLPSAEALYGELAAVWGHEHRLVAGGVRAQRLGAHDDLGGSVTDVVARMQYCDMTSYLPDDIMVKVDRCSMAVALEAREPLLDHRLVEFSWRLPARFKLAGGVSKRLLRNVLARYVPRHLFERPKMGFSIPLAVWLRGPLRDWAENLLEPRRLAAEGVFDAGQVRLLWDEHQSGRVDRAFVLWNVLMYQAWKDHYRVA